MKKLFVALLVLTLILAGCVFGNNGKTRINLLWHVKPATVSRMSLDGKGGMELTGRYAYMPTAMDRSVVKMEATVSGGNSDIFDMKIATINPYEKTADNKITLDPLQAEKGNVIVTAGDTEEIFDYTIFPAVLLSAWGNHLKETAYSFEQEKHVLFEDSDIWFVTPHDEDEEYLYQFKANVAIVPVETRDFWTDFVQINNLHELDYEEKAFVPEHTHLYCIKTKNGGYAVFRVTSRSGWDYSVMYKYSETGIFD